MKEIFDPEDYALVYPAGIEFHFWNLARNDLLYRLLAPLVGPEDLVMDVGCGPGIFLGSLRDKPVNARGVELGSPAVQPGLEATIDTATDLFDLAPELRSQIKVVVLLDVIEHIGERRQFLQRIYSELPNCTHLLVTVPARMEIWSKYDEHWNHFLRYDRPGLAKDLASGGFTATRTDYVFQWMYLSLLAMKWLGIERGSDFKSPNRTAFTTLFHRILGVVTRLETRLVPGFLAGSSIVCVAQRDETAIP